MFHSNLILNSKSNLRGAIKDNKRLSTMNDITTIDLRRN